MASYELLKDIRIFLDQHTAEEIPAQSSILEISDKVDPAEAFQTIVDHDFLSAPVYDSSSTEGKIYFGFLDTRNLVAWSVFACDEKNTSPSLEDILTHGIKRASVALSAVSVSYLARQHPLHPVSMSDSLLKTCSALSKRTCHRVPVLDSDGNISKLITQFSIISYLYNHRESFQNSLKHTVKELNIGHSPVICAPTTAPALEVFQKMEKSNLSGIAIVNEEGKVVSATSGSDLKLFLRLKVRASLQLSIMQFLNIIRQESLRAKVPVLVCDENATLDTVLAKLFATHEHRIFVIDSQKSFKPIKVISLSDILAAVSGP